MSQRYAEKNWILPISLQGKDLTLGILKPEQIGTARELKALYTNLEIHCVLIPEEKFAELFEVLYNRSLAGMRATTEEETEEDGEEKSVDFMQIELDEDIEGKKDEAPVYSVKDIEVEELVNFIIKYGISNGASDIHIEQDRVGAKLRYRIDGGRLRETATSPGSGRKFRKRSDPSFRESRSSRIWTSPSGAFPRMGYSESTTMTRQRAQRAISTSGWRPARASWGKTW